MTFNMVLQRNGGSMTRNFLSTYWRAALFTPALGAVIGYVMPPGEYAALLSAGFIFIAVPYLPFAVLMWWLFGRASSPGACIGLALAAPFIFLPFLAFFLAYGGVPAASVSDWLSMASTYADLTLVTAYGYVLLCLVGFIVSMVAFRSRAAKAEPRPIA